MTKEQPNNYLDQSSKACLDRAIKLLHRLYEPSNADQHLDLLYYALHHKGSVTDKLIQLVDHTEDPEIKTKISIFPDLNNRRYKGESLIENFNIQLADLIVQYQYKHEKILDRSAQQKLVEKLGYHKAATLTFKPEIKTYNPTRTLKINIHPTYQILYTLHHLHEYEISLAYSEEIRPSRYTILEPTLAKRLRKKTPVTYEKADNNEITITGHSEVLNQIYNTIKTLLQCKENNIMAEALVDTPTICKEIYKIFTAIDYKNTHKQLVDLQLRMAIHRISCMIHEKQIITLPVFQQQ